MMLDAKATFDEVVRKHAPDAETRDRILENRIYRQISNALAGSQEYMAMEKLYEIHEQGRYDLLDPRHAAEPQRARLPRRPAAADPVHRGPLAAAVHPADRLRHARRSAAAHRSSSASSSGSPGLDLIQDLSEFFTAMSGMVGGFRERAKKVNELLADDRTSFLVVCGPAGEPINEAVYFHRKLIESHLPFGGVIVNKVHAEGRHAAPPEDLAEQLGDALGDDELGARVADNFEDYRALADRDARNIATLAEELGSATVIEVPYLTEDVHDLRGLFQINEYLFEQPQARLRRS